ncbi:hypothetical protein EIN_228380 [Entamoeba invadens IP1]|uniref:Uncharacterized protein n=1 Tax=Entamoeba invadens IP1 TaxID=370355 RepID=A0A0A1U659_ENTIV|nr:hypothetical protein EIN_228380 [Entamoeba invadens IP1]ELP88375.1 hypothetical protein EIN_228380 [Entamoeba invadens IP1]|eukprot:XP_004255146.1 hypothetical protein EIN_228380 [Entamoeba invadens IP1]
MDEIHLLDEKWQVSTESNTSSSSTVSVGELLVTITSVEDFWGCYEAMGDFTEMKTGTDLYFLKGESKIADNYRKIVFQFPTSNKEVFNNAWLNILLACLGESMTYTEQIRGVLFSCRADYKVTIFLSRSCEEEVMKKLIEQIRSYNLLTNDVKIKYTNINKGGFLDSK